MDIHIATETAYKNGYAKGVADTRAKFSTIYVLHFSDQDNYAAYITLDQAKKVLWDSYCAEVDAETRAEYEENDRRTLEAGWIEDYGWISQVDLFDEEGKRVR